MEKEMDKATFLGLRAGWNLGIQYGLAAGRMRDLPAKDQAKAKAEMQILLSRFSACLATHRLD